MRQHRTRDRKQVEAEIELAPMIDCVFILLIFFIVTSVFVDDPGIEVDRPNVSGTELANHNVLLIAITSQNKIYMDGQELAIDQVAQRIKQAVYDPDTPVIIRADKASSHGAFAAVYSEAKKAGIKQVQFATQQPGLK